MHKGGFAILVCLRAAWRRAIPMLALGIVIFSAASTEAQAEDDDLFRVLDVKVDETEQTAAAARGKALAAGERRAWDLLLQRFVDPQQRRPLPEFSQQEIGDAIKDFWVTEEKTSAVRYIATLNYNFRPSGVRKLLGSRGIRHSTIRSKPLLVVPVYVGGGEPKLWGQGNPWREAWTGVHGRPLAPLRLPAGDGGDAAALTPEQALAGDRARLAELAQRNSGEDVLVTVASVAAPVDGAPRQLKVSSVRYTTSGPQPLADRVLPLEGAETEAEVLRQAAIAISGDVDAAWRKGTATLAKPTSRTTVVVPTGTLEQWVAMRRRLIALPQAQQVSVLSVNREEARVLIIFPGSSEELGTTLGRAGLALRNEDGAWVLSEASAQPPQGTLP